MTAATIDAVADLTENVISDDLGRLRAKLAAAVAASDRLDDQLQRLDVNDPRRPELRQQLLRAEHRELVARAMVADADGGDDEQS